MIAVIIPFYQDQPGLLHRALSSIAAQRSEPPLQILVADDGSPTPPEPELTGLPSWLCDRIAILRQSNRGPAAARNLALDAVSPEVELVAFLDSDDAWREDHLANLRMAIEVGADFYFADHRREDDPESRFVQCGFGADGPPISSACDIMWCGAGSLMREIIRRSPVGTSTVGIRRDRIGARRFPVDFRAAGEDSIFWLDILKTGPGVACGLGCEAAYGRGVSIFNHRSWGDARAVRTTLDEMRAQQFLRMHFCADAAVRTMIDARCRSLDGLLWRALMACARRGRRDGLAPSARYLCNRPQALLRLPAALLQAMGLQIPAQASSQNLPATGRIHGHRH